MLSCGWASERGTILHINRCKFSANGEADPGAADQPLLHELLLNGIQPTQLSNFPFRQVDKWQPGEAWGR